MAAGIFISYRRDDARHAAGRLADDLAQVFGSQAIFRDIEGIDPGVDFTQSLDQALNSCVVMLVLIGRKWLDIRDADGKRRLDQSGDWIRQEIATALARDVRVVPVLIEGAEMPPSESLPEDMQALTRRQALDMSDMRWRGDMQRLVEALEKLPGLERRDTAPPVAAPASAPAAVLTSGRKPLFIGIGLGALGLLLTAMLFSEDELIEPVGPAIDDSAAGALATTLPGPGTGPGENDVPSIAGVWRTGSGEVYFIEQAGRVVDLVGEEAGQSIGSGVGEFDGATLRVTMNAPESGGGGVAHCDLNAAPDLRSFSGLCIGPDGPVEAHIFK